MRRSLPAGALVLLACGSQLACSGQQPRDGPRLAVSRPYVRSDEDTAADDGQNVEDDTKVWSFGGEAAPAQRRAFAALVTRFYRAAAADDGAAACALVSREVANSVDLEQELPPEDRPAAGSNIMKGGDCAQTESLVFESEHAQLIGQAASVQLIGARVSGTAGLALLGFSAVGERELGLLFEDGRWTVDWLVDRRLE